MARKPHCATLNASNSWIAGSSSTISMFAVVIYFSIVPFLMAGDDMKEL
jgi:hypothetical protein